MVQIENKLVSLDIFEKKFTCELSACRGSCCVQGDSGAPLEEDECLILEEEYSKFSTELSKEGKAAIEKQGKWLTDQDGDRVTPLNDGKECAYTVFENGIAKCGIETAWMKGLTVFRKPLSCHLYPIRVTKVGSHSALNFHSWHICQPALAKGRENGTPVFRYLKEPIIRAFGVEFYKELESVAEALDKRQPQNF
jgi:hypothetical protein